mgnify:CR=1
KSDYAITSYFGYKKQKFDLNYIQYPILNPNLTNTYTIFNQDNDYKNSFGYKASTRGLGYFVNFKKSNLKLKKISKDIQKIDRTLTFTKI